MRHRFAPEFWVILVPHLIYACIAICNLKWWSYAPKNLAIVQKKAAFAVIVPKIKDRG